MIIATATPLKKAVDHNDIRYYRVENNKFNAVKKAGWYLRSWAYDGPIASLEPFKSCPIETAFRIIGKR